MTTFAARAAVDGDGWTLASPKLGRFTLSVPVGGLLEAGMPIGTLRILNQKHTVVVPEGVAGRLAELMVVPVNAPLCYDEIIARVTSAELGAASLTAAADSGLSLGEGEWVVRAQMDGQFYRRPSPDEPLFLEEGAVIQPGATIGLVEVMKFFYPVAYEGTTPARVVRLVAEDASPLSGGDALVVLGAV